MSAGAAEQSAEGPGVRSYERRRALAPGVTVVRPAAILTGAGVWFGVHALLAVAHLPDTRTPALSLLALAVLVAGTAAAARPLVGGPSALSRREAVLLGCVPPVVALLQTPGVHADALSGYATWWPGAIGPLLVALALRGRAGVGLLSTLAALAVVAGVVVVHVDPPARVAVLVISIAGGPPLWLAAGVGIRRLVDRSSEAVRSLGGVEEQARARLEAAQRRRQSQAARRRRVQATAEPVLGEVVAAARGGSLPLELRRRCRELESRLRDHLLASDLLDDDVLGAVDQARALGAVVTLQDAAGRALPDELHGGLRALVTVAVQAAGAGSVVTARRPPSADTVLTIVMTGPEPTVAQAAAALRRTGRQHGLRGLVVDDGGGDLWVELPDTCHHRPHRPDRPHDAALPRGDGGRPGAEKGGPAAGLAAAHERGAPLHRPARRIRLRR